jgi:hypothetical protein
LLFVLAGAEIDFDRDFVKREFFAENAQQIPLPRLIE